MPCDDCVFFARFQQNPLSPPCISCAGDRSDKGYCIAVYSEFGLMPVVSKIADPALAQEIIQRGADNGSRFRLLRWCKERRVYQYA
jgi:hypothetical protein